MSQTSFCESCGAPISPGEKVCSACGQATRTGTGAKEVSAENWSSPTPKQPKPDPGKTDRWGSPLPDSDPDSPQRWGSPQPETKRGISEPDFAYQPPSPKTKKRRNWLLIAIILLILLCICIVAAGYGGYALFTGS